ncbi:FAD-binding domain-containing protein [Aliterella atlantica]|uniref:Deoxyribodipyrimidine photolyase n=1 Tax=Aliterella atlantica CENA595 TaxID=1618023 RepID=A0A0D8ZMQ5_9CYAN|nr:deoxyribodipyrimidine photo-lyase [Aliterella atlantica]KJH69632.1 deoxyribodipyrimidine photolyase [Aliterella atlantica CENA595]
MHILWFRRDLRLSDNEIVALSTADNTEVLPCFIIDPWFYQQAAVGKARVRFLFESLEDLDNNLRARGSQLYLFEGSSVSVLQKLTSQLLQKGDRPKLFFNYDVQVQYGIERDRQIIDFYQQHNLSYHQGLNNFLQTAGERTDGWIEQYYNYVRQPLHPTPERINTPALKLDIPQLTFSQLKQKYSQFWGTENTYFKGGETQAIGTLDSFLDERFGGYHWKISRPWHTQQGATSHLSPHLAFGTISVRQVYQRTKERAAELADNPKAQFSLKAFRDRLRWHDSFTQRLYNHPELFDTNRYSEFDRYYSPAELDEEKQELFAAWKEGQTGFPLVDASMRQLLAMGWMNFRMRAMCATFLCINCGISWHHGATHYIKYLVDTDLAINQWQWQMQAGVTNPLSDTFRIYNPNKNLEESGGDLKFIYHWVPELRGYSLTEILDGAYLNESPYPAPMIDWAETRKVNGKIVSNLRKQVKERLLAEQGAELEQAAIARETVKKYWETRNKQYQQFKQK